MCGRAQIEEKRTALVGCRAGQSDRAATGGAGQAFDLNAVAIELQDAVQVAQAAGKVVVTDEGVLHFQASLEHGLRKRTASVEVYAQSAARQDLGVQRLQERHIDGAIEAEIELLRPA